MSMLRSEARRMLGALAAVMLGAAALVTLASGPAMASGPGCSGATNEVTTNTDAALRAAFTTANGLAGPQTICIDSGLGTITLGGTELAYTAVTTPALTVLGNGITISGNNTSRVINATGLLTLDGVTITGGNTTVGDGGGVQAGGNVTLTNSTLSGNTATTGDGGGMWANGTATLTNSTISGNTAHGAGGGMWANGTATLTNSTFSGNTATTGDGGGMWANGTATLTNSTISGNTAHGAGGGMWANGTATLTNSTISGNTATTGEGGGMRANGTATLVYATVVQNSAPIGANVDATAALTSFGSVVTQAGGGGANCAVSSTTSNGLNFSDDASAGVSCHFNAATDRVGTSNDPTLGTLANNGGPTQTLLPLLGSPLIDAIPLASCQADGASGITTDQRGFPRPMLNGCDIGAVEIQAVAPVPAPEPAPALVVIAPKFTG